VRSCRDCELYVYGDNGQISTEPPDDHGVELPMLRSVYKMPPPCDMCEKLIGNPVKKPLADDEDFGEWFWSLWDTFHEGRACGFPADLDPLLRSCYSEIHRISINAKGENETAKALEIMMTVFKR
jgi:hypothetical protein